ncbi:MAG: Fic family protein [Lachnospiraceae bacterium]|nr:Fic family protein [Lachnospiraceae bacterium]
MYQLADDNINGILTFDEIEDLLYNYHKNNEHIDTKEAHIVSKRIAEILSEPAFSFRPTTMISIHKHLFHDLVPYAGRIRDVNLTKQEPILNNNTVRYANYTDIQINMQYDFETEQKTDYSKFSQKQMISHIASFIRNIWQTHPFMEGNTRTTAVFMEKYLNTMGFSIDNTLFADKSQYFRNALVRADYLKPVYCLSHFQLNLYAAFGSNIMNESKVSLLNEANIADENSGN